MFGGKKGRLLEQELQTAQESQARQMQVLSGVRQKKDRFEEQFARATASRAQMDGDLSEMVNHVKYVKEIAEADDSKAEKFEKSVADTVEKVQDSAEAQQKFFEKVEDQREKIQEVVEKNKHFTTPAKYLTEVTAGVRETQQNLAEKIDQMKEYSKNMSVLSLNAAIEAGRMGEAGKKFIEAAEDVRTFSGQYEQSAQEAEDELKKLQQKNDELEEQVKHLTILLKENNISMTHLLKESTECVEEYKREYTPLEVESFDELKGIAALFGEHEKEVENRQECILMQMEEIGKEFMEQGECFDELEKICKEVITSVTM